MIGDKRVLHGTDAHNVQAIHILNDAFGTQIDFGGSDIFILGVPKEVNLHNVAPYLHHLVAGGALTIVAQSDSFPPGKVKLGRDRELATLGECQFGLNWRGKPKGLYHMDFSKHAILMDLINQIPDENGKIKGPKKSAPPAQPAQPDQHAEHAPPESPALPSYPEKHAERASEQASTDSKTDE